MDKDWLEIEIITSSEAVEPITGILYNTGVQGVAIQDSEDIEFKKENSMYGEFVDEKILQVKQGAVIKAYYKEDEKFDEYLKYIKESVDKLAQLGINKGEGLVTFSKVNETDWENNWKKYYKPTKIGSRIVVKPQWEAYSPGEQEIVVELDPGMAFGTGTHETTRLCVKALEKKVEGTSTVFDIGTGSGILSISAAKLGANKVVGIDLDPVAVKVAEKNVKYNNIDNIEIVEGDLMDVVKGKADIVVANILADIIIKLCDNVKDFIVEGGYFISSGIILSRKDDVINVLQQKNMTVEEIEIDGEWCCITARA